MTAIAPGTAWRTAWVAIILATAAFCLWPLAANVGYYGVDELDLLDALQHGYPRWDWARFTHCDLFYRPLGYALFALQLDVTGGQPTAVHALSIAHHALNTALAALLFARLGRPWWTALPLLFLPTAIGGIGWVAAAYDRWLATALLLAALALRAGGRRALWALPLFALALVTKETAAVFALVAWLVVARDRTARGVAAAITAAGIAFALWRLLYAPAAGPYAPHWNAGVPLRALGYAAFPFVPTATLAAFVHGLSGLPGLLGTGLLGILALRRAPRAAVAGALAYLAPLLPVLPLDKYDPHYTYLSSFALCWLLALAATGRVRPVAGVPLLRAFGITALFALPLAWHARVVADGFREIGAALLNLQDAYSRLPAAPAPVGVRIDPGALEVAARLFTLHLEHRGRLPPLRVVTGAAEASLRLRADGTVTAAESR